MAKLTKPAQGRLDAVLTQADAGALRGALREVFGLREAAPVDAELKLMLQAAVAAGPGCCDLTERSARAKAAQRKRWSA